MHMRQQHCDEQIEWTVPDLKSHSLFDTTLFVSKYTMLEVLAFLEPSI